MTVSDSTSPGGLPGGTGHDENKGGLLARSWFPVAVVVVVVLVVAGIWLAVTDPSPQPAATAPTLPTASVVPAPPSPAATTPAAAPVKSDSVCGLPGLAKEGTVSLAPATTAWTYEGRTAYPTTQSAGPGGQSPQGWRSCFAHTPEGAVTAAAYVLAIGNSSNFQRKKGWASYALADSPIPKSQRVTAAVGSESTSGSRVELLGFRLLSYDGASAQVEVAFRLSLTGRTGYYGAVYPLRWQDGDWKVYLATKDNPFGLVQVPDLSGYIPWSQANG